jgi:hypothetical protein
MGIANFLFENLELLHLWVGLPGDEQAGVTRELVLRSHTVQYLVMSDRLSWDEPTGVTDNIVCQIHTHIQP